MIYLASPYSHPDPAVRQERYEAVCQAAAELISRGHIVFSPVAHSHTIATYGLPGDWEFWQRTDRWFIRHCQRLVVLTLPGWRESQGVAAEMEIARGLGKPVVLLAPVSHPWPCAATV
jgi:nucleoside 2-deoxyribosyltransferase